MAGKRFYFNQKGWNSGVCTKNFDTDFIVT